MVENNVKCLELFVWWLWLWLWLEKNKRGRKMGRGRMSNPLYCPLFDSPAFDATQCFITKIQIASYAKLTFVS
jgi:hypothetical protein